MIPVAGGTFKMGCTEEQVGDCGDDEKPVHEVTLPSFSISKYEVTNEQFAAFLNAKGNQEEGGNTWYGRYRGSRLKKNSSGVFEVIEGYERHPVVYISWYGARAYCKWLSERTGQNYRLPTEAEWEYAARGGTQSKGYKYAGSDNISEVAWYNSNSDSDTHEVGTRDPNELGIYDMSGNVYEWCADTWHDNYENAPNDGIAWIKGGNNSTRVVRGGSWLDDDDLCRATYRNFYFYSNYHYNNFGCRVIRY